MAYINYDLATHLRGNNFDQQLPFISASKPLLRISSPPRSDILDYKIVRRPKFVPVSKPLPRIPSPPRCLKYVRVRNSIPSFRSTINKPLVGTLSSRCSIKTPKVSKKTDEEIAHTTSTVNKTTAEEFVGVEETPIIKVTRTEIGYCKYRDTCQNKEEPSSPENNQPSRPGKQWELLFTIPVSHKAVFADNTEDEYLKIDNNTSKVRCTDNNCSAYFLDKYWRLE